MSKTRKKYHAPVLPIYMTGLVFLICSFILPIYRLGYMLIAAVISVCTYLLFRILCPLRVDIEEVEYSTGDEYVDELLDSINKNLDVLHQLNVDIPDPHLTQAMNRMENAGRGILNEIEKEKGKFKEITRFANYYLPETIKIMSSYAELEKNGVKGDNSQQIYAEISQNADTMALVFENQLDSLYRSEALDISTDIEVLESIAQSQNLVK